MLFRSVVVVVVLLLLMRRLLQLTSSLARLLRQSYPGSGPSKGGKTPTSCLWCIALLGEVTVQEELVELKVSNNGYCLAS